MGSLSLTEILVGLGTLAAGIGIFRAGFALGSSLGRVAESFERAVTSHLEGQQSLIEIGKGMAESLCLLPHLVEGQADILKAQKATDTSVRALWRDYALEHPLGAENEPDPTAAP